MIERGKKIYLCRPDRSIITQLNGVRTEGVVYTHQIKMQDVLTFEVDEYIDVDGRKVKSNGYDLLDVFMTLYLEDVGYFIMQHPVTQNDGISEYKSITAQSIDIEWVKRKWIGLRVNTGTDDSLEQLADDNLNELGFAKEFVTFYNPNNPQLSLIHQVLTKMPEWSVLNADIDSSLWAKKMRIDLQSTNLFNLMTQIVAPKVGCLILFDIQNLRIKAIAKENLDGSQYDTNIYISHRNLANEINMGITEDSVFTKLNCQGNDSLDFKDVNYNDASIVNYSYFMHEPYMSSALADKITAWQAWRDEHRDEFTQLSKDRASVNEDIYTVQYKLPIDATDWSQWDAMELDLLHENLDYYNALITSLQVSVDPDPQYDAEEKYIPWKKQDGTIDHDRYLSELYDLANGYGGYYTYYEVITYVIPNIETAIENAGDPEPQDYNKAYETDWKLYGIEELKGKQKRYEAILDSLSDYSKPWSELTTEEKAKYANDENMYNSNGRTKYVEVSGYLGDENTQGTLLYTLKALNTQLAQLKTRLSNIDEQRASLVETAKMSNEQWGLTTEELRIVATLTVDSDYVNNNILTTAVDTTITKIDREMELYEDSVNKLIELSQPQYSFTVGLDNLLGIDTFKRWKEDFKLLNFFRLGLKDDSSVKLRMVRYSYNPCEITEDLDIEFSSMITSKSGKSDLTDIIQNSAGVSSTGTISVGTGGADSQLQYMTSLLDVLTKSQIFKNSVTNIAGDVIEGTQLTVDSGYVSNLVSQFISAADINVGQITGTTAEFETLFSTYITGDYIVAETLKATSANFQRLTSEIIEVGKTKITNDVISAATIQGSQITGEIGQFATVNVSKLTGDFATFGTTISQYIQADQISGDFAEFGRIISPYIDAGTVTADAVIAALVEADAATVGDLSAKNAFIDYLNANLVLAKGITTDNLTANLATINVANVGQTFTSSLTTLASQAATSTITKAYIQSAVIGEISVADLATHTATAQQIVLISSDGTHPAIAFNNATQQFYDSNGRVRVQIGQDGNGDFNFVVVGADGSTALFDSTGIKQAGIPNSTIINNMIADNTIAEGKLAFSVMKQGDTIQLSQVYDGQSQFGAEYTTFKTGTEGRLSDIESQKMYRVEVTSDSGTVFISGSVGCILSARVYSWDEDITNTLSASSFAWRRKSMDTAGDNDWDDAHTGMKTVTITSADLDDQAMFSCEVTLADGTSASS